MQRVEVFFTGNVQGVGFRHTVFQLTSELPITGWVENLSDGRVHLIAEAERSVLDDFLDRVSDQMHSRIRHRTVDWQPACNNLKPFSIKRF